jgi:crotonobetainyl-CoA:carnitine CoA-transferase CaiB-like acyl-CoA transferase
MPYQLLSGIRVVEVAWLAAGILGQHLADLGADVIKVEKPGEGDYSRTIGPVSLGTDDGLSFHYLRWNRGKKSIELDLKTPEGRETFLRLVEKADVVVEGLRAGAMDRWGLGYETLRERNPSVVFCTLSGMGASGPYEKLPMHGMAFDAYTGFMPPAYRDDGSPRVPGEHGGLLEYNTGGLYAAVGVLGALVRAIRTGEGAMIEVAQTEALAMLRSERLEIAINADKVMRRKTYGPGEGIVESTRSTYYTTADDRIVFVQALERKFWENFCRAVGRSDLLEKYPSYVEYDHQPANAELLRELQEIFRSRTLAEWVQTFIEENIPGSPVYTVEELADDPHFKARPNVEDVEYPELGVMKLVTTPIRVNGEPFGIALAPTVGQHTAQVLAALDDDERAASGGATESGAQHAET